MYPAIAVLQALTGEAQTENNVDLSPTTVDSWAHDDREEAILWVGSVGGMEANLVKRFDVPYREIPAAGVHGVGLRALPGNLFRLWRGYWQSKRIIRDFQPDILFFTGGYVAVPMAMAGRRISSILFVPDIEPGLALKVLANFADRIAVTAKESLAYFPRHKGVHVTGYPVRKDVTAWGKDEAKRVLGLRDDLPTLLVFGGSKGARSINRALLGILPQLLPEMQVIHISGQLDWSAVESARLNLTSRDDSSAIDYAERYHAFPYLHDEMGAALAAADLVVARAGASTLGEFPNFGLPAILVPYPYAWRYQQVNAQYLARQGAAMIMQDADMPQGLLPMILELIRDHNRREQMQEAMRALAQPDAAQKISQLARSLVGKKRDRERI